MALPIASISRSIAASRGPPLNVKTRVAIDAIVNMPIATGREPRCETLKPRAMDAMLLRTGFSGQRTDEPKAVDDPNNLFAPIAGYDRAEGDFGGQALQRSPATWLDMHPAVRDFVAGVALVAATTMAVRGLRDTSGYTRAMSRRSRR